MFYNLQRKTSVGERFSWESRGMDDLCAKEKNRERKKKEKKTRKRRKRKKKELKIIENELISVDC